MPLVWSLVIVAVALVGLVVLVLAALKPLRRTTTVAAALQEELRSKGGMLAARVAALKVRWAERRTVPVTGDVTRDVTGNVSRDVTGDVVVDEPWPTTAGA